MKKRTKLYLSGAAGLFAVIALTSCTKSFCSNQDTGRMLFAFDPGFTSYVAGGSDSFSVTKNGHTYSIDGYTKTYATYYETEEKTGFYLGEQELTYFNTINKSVKDNGLRSINADNIEYFKKLDELVLESVLTEKLIENNENYTYHLNVEADYASFQRDLSFYSYLKYVDDNDATMWERWETLGQKAYEAVGQDVAPSSDFLKVYKTAMTNNVAQYRTCLTTKTDKYGMYGYDASGIFVEAKTWKYAWQKGFFIAAC